MKNELVLSVRTQRAQVYLVGKKIEKYVQELTKLKEKDDLILSIFNFCEEYLNIDKDLENNITNQLRVSRSLEESNYKKNIDSLKSLIDAEIKIYQKIMKKVAFKTKFNSIVKNWKSSKFLNVSSISTGASGSALAIYSTVNEMYMQDSNYVGIAGISLMISSIIMLSIYLIEFPKAVILEYEKSLGIEKDEKKDTMINRFYHWLRS